MHLIELFIRNPVKISVALILLTLFGVISMFHMPVQLTPEVQTPTLTIETRWPGASPQEVEREIIQEQEEQIKSVEGINKMTAEAMDSWGRITLEFPVGTDMSEALLKVNTRLQQVREYPEDADEPTISTANASDRPIAWFMLTQYVPDVAEIQAFAEKHPSLRAALTPAIDANNSAFRSVRLRELAEKHPEVRELLPKQDVDVLKLKRFAEDHIEARFERVLGVSQSNVLGGQEDEMQVVVDPERLAARQLTVADVRAALRGQNKDTSGGDFWEGKRRYVLRTLGQFRNPEQVANVIIARREDQPVYIKDIGTVRLGHKKPDGLVRHLGITCLAVNCIRESNSNVLDVMQGLREATKELNEGILKRRGLLLELVYDETDYIYSAIGLVNENIIEGGLLTILSLLLFLRSLRSTFIVALPVPASIVGTFLIMMLLGRSLNVISLAGMAFAVGMLVDNGIVVLENIYRHNQEFGKPPFRAALDGAREVWGAIVAASVANLAVFLPVLFVQEEAGQLFRDIALAVSAAVTISVFVAIMVIPPAAARLLAHDQGEDDLQPSSNGDSEELLADTRRGVERRWRNSRLAHGLTPVWRLARSVINLLLVPLDAAARAFVNTVVRINEVLQRRRLIGFATVVGITFTATGLAYLMIPQVEYLPSGNRNLVFAILLPPPGYNLDKLMEMGKQVEAQLMPFCEAKPGSVEEAKLGFPAIGDLFFVARGRQVFMGVRAADPLKAGGLIPLIRKVASDLPGTFAVAKQSSLFEQGLSAGRTVDIEIVGPELSKLVALGGQVLGKVRSVIPNAQAIPQPSLDLSNPEMHVVPKWEQAADMGITATDLGYMVDSFVDGAYASDYFIGGEKIDLTIIGEARMVQHTQDINALSIATPTGELVPLAAIANVELRSGPEQINHRERQRAITIQVSPPPDMPLELAMSKIQTEIVAPLWDSGQLEGGAYRVSLQGTADKLRTAWGVLRLNFLLALLITYLMMAALFESWIYPLVIIVSVPIGAVGGFAGLWLLNQFVLQPLDVLTMLGFVILIGTVVNNPILIVEQALVHIREEKMGHREAVLASVRNRIRPIFMTVFATVLGLLPLVIAPGAGSELYRGIGSVLLGGIIVSTLVTLVVVPTFFGLALEMIEALGGKRKDRPALRGTTSETTAPRPLQTVST